MNDNDKDYFQRSSSSCGFLHPTFSTISPKSMIEMKRPYVHGKFIFVGNEKLYIRGVTYGPFRPGENGDIYQPETVERDFAQIATNGINSIRVYTVPPRWLLDIAQRYGLYVMIGLPWEQHIAFLDDKKRIRNIEKQIRAGIRVCASHPAVLCYAIGNEIPASIVRWYGKHRIERFLERLYHAAKDEDPEGIVTYVNYPTTEYLELPFIDFVCFNVYIESKDPFDAYIARLHNIAEDRPLVIAEIGFDSFGHGEDAQANALDWQIRSTFEGGCAGAFVFAWTDEWYRGGFDITDWGFGLTRRDRSPKPALTDVQKAFSEVPFPSNLNWTSVSVVLCSYNGSKTIRDCCEGLSNLKYPNFEVIVVNDGSTDATAEIAREYGFQVIQTENGGLSKARNIGMKAAKGDIVAYIDDDARPDPHWLTYLVAKFSNTDHAGIGGPNIAPSDDGPIADCVANAPGGPVHILISDQEAEHIPGCNMAFRKDCLKEIDGFDAQFRTAGDDVDLCWRLQQKGWTLGFSPSAMVWHHRRNSVRAYWKQQKGYGKAEALLEKKWPEKYNRFGHLTWVGRIYGKGLAQSIGYFRNRIYHGIWGSAPFQRLYQSTQNTFLSFPLMPEWFIFIAILFGVSAMGLLWKPLLLLSPFFIFALGISVVQAFLGSAKASFNNPSLSRFDRLKLHFLTAILHLIQPIARLYGRIQHGLTLWRRHGTSDLRLAFPRSHNSTIWSESWHASEEWLYSIELALKNQGAIVRCGGDYDGYDLEIQSGLFSSVYMRMAIEEHGGGKQLIRFRSWLRLSIPFLIFISLLIGVSIISAIDHEWLVSAILGFITLLLIIRVFMDCGYAVNAFLNAVKHLDASKLLDDL